MRVCAPDLGQEHFYAFLPIEKVAESVIIFPYIKQDTGFIKPFKVSIAFVLNASEVRGIRPRNSI